MDCVEVAVQSKPDCKEVAVQTHSAVEATGKAIASMHQHMYYFM